DCISVKNLHDGIMTGRNCLIDGCNVVSNMLDGVFAGDSCQLCNCVVNSNGEDGIEVDRQCTVTRCHVCSNGRTGINTLSSFNTLDNNTVISNGINRVYPLASCAGIQIGSMNNLIIRNRLSSNLSVDFNIGPGNQIGTVIPPPVPGTPGVVGNAGGGFGAVDPFANIVY
ncbi:MAG: hypothetical protein KAH12_03075, partial [Anaerolineales bacterium]|nr:hypothetical protein [Anaerolineales bacterium]